MKNSKKPNKLKNNNNLNVNKSLKAYNKKLSSYKVNMRKLEKLKSKSTDKTKSIFNVYYSLKH